MLSTLDLLVVTSLDPAAFDIENIIYSFYRTHYPKEGVYRTEPSLSVSVPWLNVRCQTPTAACTAFQLSSPI
jgi:hypothetical protein